MLIQSPRPTHLPTMCIPSRCLFKDIIDNGLDKCMVDG